LGQFKKSFVTLSDLESYQNKAADNFGAILFRFAYDSLIIHRITFGDPVRGSDLKEKALTRSAWLRAFFICRSSRI
jgi:hypothetical protein